MCFTPTDASDPNATGEWSIIAASILQRRSFRLAALLVGLGCTSLLAYSLQRLLDSPRTGDLPLVIEKRYALSLREISGLSLSPTDDAEHLELSAVGDRFATIKTALIDSRGQTLIAQQQIDFAAGIVNEFSLCASERIIACKKLTDDMTRQWEAIASDASGRYFLLQEQLATIVAYDPDKEQVVAIINLAHFDLSSRQSKTEVVKQKANALGEGMVLLGNGRVLVVKERESAAIVEFAPEGELARGYEPSYRLRQGAIFPLPLKRQVFVPLAHWQIPSKFRGCDLSEIQTDAGGRLYVLSQSCRFIGLVGSLEVNAKEFRLQKTWALPSELRRVESFVVLPDERFVVASDHKSRSVDNVFVLH